MPTTPRQHQAHRYAAPAALLAALLLAIAPALASAASPPVTGQAASANGAFLDYAPPPPGGAGALCLVDSGVNANPDTTPGLLSATALDGGSGSDADPRGHGTVNAAIAGGAGHGVLGAWPQLKIVSVRATNVPSPGQEPNFEFDDYTRGILQCLQTVAGAHVEAIDLPLSSTIPPTPDQTATFANAVTNAQTRGISILAAAGNDPGAIQLPASEPGIFAVGAGQVTAKVNDPAPNAICPLSPTIGLAFFAPGCGVDTIDPSTDAPKCCGNGTSQASAYTAGVLVALRSYDPALTPEKAVRLLLSTTTNGHLDIAAAFRADGLGAIVDAGNAAIPKPPAPPPASTPPPTTGRPTAVALPRVKSVTWRRGLLRITLKSIPKGARLHAKITFAHRGPLYLATARRLLRKRTPRPTLVVLHLTQGAASGATVSIKV